MSLTALLHAETNLVGRVVTTAVTAASTSIKVQFTDSKTGEARTPQSTTKYFTFDKDNEKFEIIKASSHSTAAGITTITVATNGRALPLFGIGAGSATGSTHPIGSQAGCVDIHWMCEILNNIIDGTEGTTGTSFKIGNEADDDIYLYAWNADANRPYIKYDKTTNKWIISNDGTNSYDPQAGGSGVTAGDGISLTAGDLDIDLTDTVIFKSSSAGAADSGKVPRLNASGQLSTTFIALAPTDLTGVSANVTAANLNTLTGGGNADALHTHTGSGLSFTAYEAISLNDAVALLPITVQYYAQLTEADLNIGDTNGTRGFAIKIIPTITSSTLTTMLFRGKEAVNGSTNGDLNITIETDSGGSPSGTVITNGSANTIAQATIRTWNTSYSSRTATWAAAPTLTAGTTYWIVFKMSFTDATNYVKLGVNSSYDENYLTMTRQTFDSSSSTWGSAVTNSVPFFWFDNQPNILGSALCQCDANWGGRTWAFVGFARAAISANASGAIYYDVNPGFTGLVPGADYYLSSTAGGISTTYASNEYKEGTAPTVFYYKIGRAVNTTTLKIQPGAKRIVLREKDALSASTTRNYIFWFKPDILRVSMSEISSNGANNDGASSSGYALDHGTSTAQQMATGMVYNYGANATHNGADGINIAMTTAASRGFTGNASGAFSQAGLTQAYSMTNNGQLKGFIEAEAY